MTTDVVRVFGSYRIESNNEGISRGGNIILDTTGQDPADLSSFDKTVLINGDLVVSGNTIFGSVTEQNIVNTNITDNIVVLNSGETAGFVNHGGGRTSGIVIDRGTAASNTLSATLLYNDAVYWNQTTRGVWQFTSALKNATDPKYSAIKVNAIVFDEGTGNDDGGINSDGRLLMFAGQRGILNVGVNGGGIPEEGYDPLLTPSNILPENNSYANRVTDPNDIPNKYYVDHVVSQASVTSNAEQAKKLIQGQSSVLITDFTTNGEGFTPSNVTTYLDNVAVYQVNATGFSTKFITVDGTTIRTVNTGSTYTNLYLQAASNGTIFLRNPFIIPPVTTPPPQPPSGYVTVYSTSTPRLGNTGIMFVNGANGNRDELASARRAMVFGLVL